MKRSPDGWALHSPTIMMTDDMDEETKTPTMVDNKPDGSVEGNKNGDGHDGDAEIIKLKIVNPSVHVEDYNGPLHVLKSLWKEGKQFSINLRFDCSSYDDLQKFINYFSGLTEKTDTLNFPFTKYEYVSNLNVEFSEAEIVKNE